MAEAAGMDVDHLGSGNRMCSVVFADIVQYSQKLVSQQVTLKARFSAFLAAALEHTATADRLVVDTGDGAALCFLGDPEDALFTANSLRSRVLETRGPPRPALRLGINLGPVRVVKDINGHTNVIGDGINWAQRVMSFAEPNQILVSRSYYEVVSRLSPEYAQLFHYAGLHRDKHVRQHEVYEVQLSATLAGRAATALPQGAAGSVGPAGRRGRVRRWPRPLGPQSADHGPHRRDRPGGETGRPQSGRARDRCAGTLREAGRERAGISPRGVPGGPSRPRRGPAARTVRAACHPYRRRREPEGFHGRRGANMSAFSSPFGLIRCIRNGHPCRAGDFPQGNYTRA